MSWNYRIGTKIFSYKKEFEGKNEELAKQPDSRFFSIIEVYYSKKGIPDGYTEPNILSNWENLKDLKGTFKLVEQAFTKPIIDLDDFPKIWVRPEDRELTQEDRMKLIQATLKNTKSF